jgi:CubicO group peptidase (beta-lactamase class C family)
MIDYCVYDKTTKISVAIIDNGSVTYHTYGVDGEEDMLYDYEIGSISKTYLGLLFSKAISEGKVQLNDSISKYLDLSSNRYYPTIERLLTHTSGYEGYYFESEMIATRYAQKTTNDFYGISREKILKRIQKVKLKDKDYEFKYSNFGISVLGLVLEKVYNKSFTEILTSFVKNDLGLNNTTVASYSGNLHGYWIWEDNDGYIPAGSIISTIKDMATYLKIYLDDSLPYAKQAITQIKKVDGNNPTYNAMNIRIDSIGMTWVHDDTNGITWHNGATGAFNTYIAFNDNKTKGVVILSNLSPTDRIPMTTIGTKLMLEIMN